MVTKIKINPRYIEEIMALQELKSSLKRRLIEGNLGGMAHQDDCLGVIPSNCSAVLIQMGNNAIKENIESAITFCEEQLVELGIPKEDAKKDIVIHSHTARKLKAEWYTREARRNASIEVPRIKSQSRSAERLGQ